MTFVGIVLTAGASLRMGRCKALLHRDGKTWLDHGIDALTTGGCERVVVVVAEPHAGAILETLAAHPATTSVNNPEPELGPLRSLQLALPLAKPATAALVALIDHPGVRWQTVAALIEHYRTRPSAVVKPEYQGRAGHPFLVGADAWARVLSADPTHDSMRSVLRRASSYARVQVNDAAVLQDFDDVQSLPDDDRT